MRTTKALQGCGVLGLTLAGTVLGLLLGSQPARASFHLMQIEQVIGAVCGKPSQQAIQLRMRGPGQNLVSQARLVAYDAQGLNPVVVIDFTTNVANQGTGVTILATTAAFTAAGHGPSPDFTLTNPIPPLYLAAGRLTFEDDFGNVYWSLAWGGDFYTGPTTGLIDNDLDGEFGPPFSGPLPTSHGGSLLYQRAANTRSIANATDYAVSDGDAIFTNNGGASASVIVGCIFGDGFESGNPASWTLLVP